MEKIFIFGIYLKRLRLCKRDEFVTRIYENKNIAGAITSRHIVAIGLRNH